MNFKKRLFVLTILCLCGLGFAYASASSFTVERIEVRGLQRVPLATVLNYLPVKAGGEFNSADGPDIIKALYNTGFFSNVELERQRDVLVVVVQERPIIGSVEFSGNKKIDKKKVDEILKNANVTPGTVYDNAKLNEIVQGLSQAYFNLGYQNITIDPQVKSRPRNRVDIDVVVSEGKPVKVQKIIIEANQAFSQSQLMANFSLTTPGLLTWFTHTDNYSEQQLDQDLQKLSDYYMDRGYIHFQILSRKIEITPDKKSASIVITVSEGEEYTISGYSLSENVANHADAIKKLITFKPGEVFSRKKVVEVDDSIAKYLAGKGYAFPVVNATPVINDNNHTVFLNYVVTQGKRIYVRRINIGGNDRTQSMVIRREFRQLEASVFSLSRVDESKRRLANLPYLKDIQATPVPVDGASDQVDLDVSVKEVRAGKASINGGYSDTDGFLYGANIFEPNFLGTGKMVSAGFQRSQYSNFYSVGYNNPYYTLGGISRGFDVFYSNTYPGNVNLSPYTMNSYGMNVNYGYPISEYSDINFGYGYQNVEITTTSSTGVEVLNFLQQHNSPYNDFPLTAGWTYSNLDRFIFPTEGYRQQIVAEAGVPLTNSSLSYYITSFKNTWYYPLTKNASFIFSPHTNFGYGNGYGDVSELPFFKNFYAGGYSSVPGYEANTLGPKDQNNNALGGNVLATGGLDLIFPNYISENLRTALTFNFGNVYQNQMVLNDLRYSAGLMINWNSPFGLLGVSIAEPLNKQAGDTTAPFQFSFGTSI